MVLRNYVELEPGKPSRMHFSNHEIQVRTIVDPVTGRPKAINALVFTVDELNGQKIVGFYSTLSQKHAADFSPFLVANRYRDYDFVVSVEGQGFQRQYSVRVVPR